MEFSMTQQRMTPPIDDPGPFATLASWEQFLTEMQPEPDTILKSLIVQKAKRMIEMKKREAERPSRAAQPVPARRSQLLIDPWQDSVVTRANWDSSAVSQTNIDKDQQFDGIAASSGKVGTVGTLDRVRVPVSFILAWGRRRGPDVRAALGWVWKWRHPCWTPTGDA
jgi:hypothetical protein